MNDRTDAVGGSVQATEAELEARRVVAYTDGACIGNPGPGGYAAIMIRGAQRRILKGTARRTTNQRMEVRAAIRAIASMKTDAPLTFVSDSEYLVKGAGEWLPAWKRRGWRTAGKKPVSNADLWQELDRLIAAHGGRITFEWTRGHAGHEWNERADQLAYAQAVKAKGRSVRR